MVDESDAPSQGPDIEALVSMVPTTPTQLRFFFDTAEVEMQDGRKLPYIVTSFLTPSGVTRYWWDTQGMKRFCVKGIDMAKQAEKNVSPLTVAKAMPITDQGDKAAKQAAADVLKRR